MSDESVAAMADVEERSEKQILLTAIQREARLAGGRWAVSAIGCESGEEISLHPDDLFPAASVIKVPLLAALYAARDTGLVSLDEVRELRQEDVVGGSGVLLELHPGLPLTLEDLARLMIVVSDNTATNMLIDRLGVPFIEEFLLSNGFCRMKLQRRLFDLNARAQGRDNLITAGEVAELLRRMHLGDLPPLSPASCEECLSIMRRQQHREKLPALLPPGAVVASKPGGLEDVTHDCGLVITESGKAYSVAILCADFRDRRAAEHAVALISLRLYEYFDSGGSQPVG
jgi:beta-lactamase class A